MIRHRNQKLPPVQRRTRTARDYTSLLTAAVTMMETIAMLGEDSLAPAVAPPPPSTGAARALADRTGRVLRSVAIEQRRMVSPLRRVLGPRLWMHLCFLTDLVALGGAAATALAATPSDLSPR